MAYSPMARLEPDAKAMAKRAKASWKYTAPLPTGGARP
jgi:hypothetical protein